MSLLVVVLDACILVPASLRDTLLRAADADLYRLQWTDNILEEVERNLIGKIGLRKEQARNLLDVMKGEFPEAHIIQHTDLIEAMPINAKDRHVLAAAVTCKAQIIVTQNLRDFPNNVLHPFKVVAQSPDEFLIKLFLLNPDRIAEIIVEQANDLRNPPMGVAEVLATLEQHAPNFVWLVGNKIDNSQY